MASFVSEREIEKSRNLKKQRQNEALKLAKQVYERKQEVNLQKKKRGEDSWMLSSLEDRLSKESKKHKHSHKEKKKHKKSKKEYSSSSSDSDVEDAWVEKQTLVVQQKDKWMEQDFMSGIKTTSSKELREKANAGKSSPQIARLSTIDQAGQHKNELNPFWKSGGVGLPPTKKSDDHSALVPDLSWLQRSLKRMREESEESGRDVKDIVANRYGSWQAFQELLEKAEAKANKGNNDRGQRSFHDPPRRRFRKPGEDDSSFNDSRSRVKNRHSRDENVSSSRHSRDENVSSSRHSRDENASSSRHSRDKYASSSRERSAWKKNKSLDSPKTISTEQEKAQPNIISDNNTKEDNPVRKPDPDKLSDSTSKNDQNNEAKPHSSENKIGKILTEEEKNAIGAKIIKAELLGNDALVEKLKRKMEISKELEKSLKDSEQNHSVQHKNRENEEKDLSGSSSEDETVVLTRTTKTGQSWPVTESEFPSSSSKRKRSKMKIRDHGDDGKREKYFADDDKYSLKDLVERERSGVEDEKERLSCLSSKLFARTDQDNYTLDDMFESEVGKVNYKGHDDGHNRNKAISNHKKLMRRMEKCKFCFGNTENPKHLIIAIGRVSYLRLPSYSVLQPGHCIIAPMHHCTTGTVLDEDVWDELRKFMQSLRNLFLKQDKDCVFLQTCMGLKYLPHFYIECIPLPNELGDLAPIYFKKAIQDCEGEWVQNKKLIDTRGKSVRDKIPAGLPYFAVDFGLDGGFAHVVEDESKFPVYFGREVLGGMLDAEPHLWRKPRDERFNEQTKRVIEFEKWFSNFDWTKTELS